MNNDFKVLIYLFQSPELKITEVLYFIGNHLIFKGYDIGKRVEDIFRP